MFGLVEAISNPAYAASVGLLKWGLSQADDYGGPPGDGAFGRLKEWLRSFFPE
jgi:hypothetical protein